MVLAELVEIGLLLTIIGGITMLSNFITGIFLIAFFLSRAQQLLPFRNGYQEGEGEIVDFTKRDDSDSMAAEPTRNPVIRYYNAYQREMVEEELWNSGIHSPEAKQLFSGEKQGIVEPGTIVAVQYTEKAVRIVDKRFVSEKRYDIKNYVRPIVMCLIAGVIGAILLMMGTAF